VSCSNVLLLNPLSAKLNPICHLLALIAAHHILHVSGVRANRTFPLDLQSVPFFNVFPTKLYVFVTITVRAKCPNQSQKMKKLLYFDRAKFGVKGHDAIDDGGFGILQMATASLRNCWVWAKYREESVVKTSGGQPDVLQIAQGRRTSGGEPVQMFRPLTQQLATDGSV
jgi:hypothetical protein